MLNISSKTESHILVLIFGPHVPLWLPSIVTLHLYLRQCTQVQVWRNVQYSDFRMLAGMLKATICNFFCSLHFLCFDLSKYISIVHKHSAMTGSWSLNSYRGSLIALDAHEIGISLVNVKFVRR